MTDIISGVRHIGPAYPVKPVQPAQKDREPGERHKQDPQKKPKSDERPDDDKPTIDEHV